MKKLLTLSFALMLYISAQAQVKNHDGIVPYNEDKDKIEYKEALNQEGTKAELYDRALKHLKSFFPNPSGVLKQKSKEEGYINGTAKTTLYNTDKKGNKTKGPLIQYTFKLEFKDGKYRYTISDFTIQAASEFKIERWLKEDKYKGEIYASYLQQIDEYIDKFTDKLNEAMEKKEEKKDEW